MCFAIWDFAAFQCWKVFIVESGVACLPGASVAVQKPSDNGVFLLCLANALVYLFDHVLRIGFISKSLYLYHSFARPWQFVTSAFCHASWQHLSSNIFMLYVFGKIIEEEEGAFGVILTYIVGAVGEQNMFVKSFPSPCLAKLISSNVMPRSSVGLLV